MFSLKQEQGALHCINKLYTPLRSQVNNILYLTIEILAHPFFRFEGDDHVCDVPIRPDEAVLGAEISVPTSDGSVTMCLKECDRDNPSDFVAKAGHGKKGDALTYLPNF